MVNSQIVVDKDAKELDKEERANKTVQQQKDNPEIIEETVKEKDPIKTVTAVKKEEMAATDYSDLNVTPLKITTTNTPDTSSHHDENFSEKSKNAAPPTMWTFF